MAHKTESENREFDDAADELESDFTDELEPSPPARRRAASGWFAERRGVITGIGIGLAIAAGGMLVSRLISRPAASNPQAGSPTMTASAQSVTVATVEQTPVARTLDTTGGSVIAADLLPVLPQATGLQVREVLADDGDSVQAGQVLAVLDNSVLQAQLNQAKAQVASAQAIVRQKRAAVGQAQATLAESQSNQSRYQGLARQGAISRQEAESRATTATTAQEQVRLARADVSSAVAEVQSRQAQVQQLQTQIGQTLVRAPAAGTVAEQIAQVGDVTSGSQKLFSIIRNGDLELQVKIPATQLSAVRVGAPVQVTSSTNRQIRLQGRVETIAPLVDPQSRQASVEVDLPPSPLLRPGMFLQAAVVSGQALGLTVPASAVQFQAEGDPIVYRLPSDRAQAQPVEVGETVGGAGTNARIEIKRGLRLGDRVITTGVGFLKDGDRVRVASAPATGSPVTP